MALQINKLRVVLHCFALALLLLAGFILLSFKSFSSKNFVSYATSPENIALYFKNDSGKRIGSLKNLKKHVHGKGKKLLFAMNGGMYNPDRAPVGLYVENGKVITEKDTSDGEGNFYMTPNGIFHIDANNKAFVTTTDNYTSNDAVTYATQSGPMLVIDSNIHPQFRKGSKHTNIRNGVGILPDGRVVMAMSKEKINFYDFAMYFKERGCKNALYLDGLVSLLG
jgi:uncharacterized protein YigE (DUF2233 family)